MKVRLACQVLLFAAPTCHKKLLERCLDEHLFLALRCPVQHTGLLPDLDVA